VSREGSLGKLHSVINYHRAAQRFLRMMFPPLRPTVLILIYPDSVPVDPLHQDW
jgi:hypothetical protein